MEAGIHSLAFPAANNADFHSPTHWTQPDTKCPENRLKAAATKIKEKCTDLKIGHYKSWAVGLGRPTLQRREACGMPVLRSVYTGTNWGTQNKNL
jgi:hypothetical protein